MLLNTGNSISVIFWVHGTVLYLATSLQHNFRKTQTRIPLHTTAPMFIKRRQKPRSPPGKASRLQGTAFLDYYIPFFAYSQEWALFAGVVRRSVSQSRTATRPSHPRNHSPVKCTAAMVARRYPLFKVNSSTRYTPTMDKPLGSNYLLFKETIRKPFTAFEYTRVCPDYSIWSRFLKKMLLRLIEGKLWYWKRLLASGIDLVLRCVVAKGNLFTI